MVGVADQYEAFPYPERDPADEKKRLIHGSPSHPLEMDHFLWNGARDWSKPLRALIAGGGTGDGLIQLAALLSMVGRPYEITYIDLSTAARAVAEARAAVRGLTGITFLTGSLLDAPDLGRFDYIDCCGVLHHLAEPRAGFQALRASLAPGGGLGFMVYAPYGRSGVYPLQEAFGALLPGPPETRLTEARRIFERLPEGHPFRRNPHLVDHKASDAGFYDLLLHSQDQAFSVRALNAVLEAADLSLTGFTEPARYDLARFAEIPDGMDAVTQMDLAEKLDGTIKTHTGYAMAQEEAVQPATGHAMTAIPHFKDIPAAKLASMVAKSGRVRLSHGETKHILEIPKSAAPLIARIDGRKSLEQIRDAAGMDPIAFGSAWGPASRVLAGWGQLWYSRLLAR